MLEFPTYHSILSTLSILKKNKDPSLRFMNQFIKIYTPKKSLPIFVDIRFFL